MKSRALVAVAAALTVLLTSLGASGAGATGGGPGDRGGDRGSHASHASHASQAGGGPGRHSVGVPLSSLGHDKAPSAPGSTRNPQSPRHPTYRVGAGMTFVSPIDKSRHEITSKILRAINHSQKGSLIRLVSWNFDSDSYTKALIAAHKRGVSVRLIMARTLAEEQSGGGPFARLRSALRGSGNARRGPVLRSWARTCSHSCRGHGGAMHAKYYIFSQTGASQRVVMNTSANLTGASSNVQWNEMYTVVGSDKTYDNYMDVFKQATADHPARYHQYRDGNIVGWWYPRLGRSDLVMDMLNQVRCSGAVNSGIGGKTSIRVAQDVFNNKRGVRIAKKLLSLYREGCNVRLVYSQAVADTRQYVTALPNNHLVADRNGDGAYDLYLHAKLLAISGHYGRSRNYHVIMDGSANYSATAVQSDEQGMIIVGPRIERAYGNFIDKMFNTKLQGSSRTMPRVDAEGHRIDPYRNMEG